MNENQSVADDLVRLKVAFGTLNITRTGIVKSILDATKDFQSFLQIAKLHDFDGQLKGSEFKVQLPIRLIKESGDVVDSTISLYKSRTRGDERTWINSLHEIVNPGDSLIVAHSGLALFAFSASNRAAIEKLPVSRDGPVPPPSIFENLLEDLRRLADRGFILAPEAGSTSVGRLLESELGIPMNSSKNPDYHGIELKTARNLNGRSTMFAQVPDWAASRVKSSGDILRQFGYQTPEGRKLSCTLSVKSANSQKLFLHLERDERSLHARCNELDPIDVVMWPLELLEERFVQKHSHTVWIQANCQTDYDKEYVKFVSIERTTDPVVEEFGNMLRQGKISVDFLIRENGDKGYLFKVGPAGREKLFRGSRKFLLTNDPLDL